MLYSLKKIALLFLGFSVFFGLTFASSISVYPMITDLTLQNRYQDIQVQNTGNNTAYVAITVYRVNNPGTADQSFSSLNDNPYQIGLITTPNKMVIPEGQMRLARILYIGDPVSSDAIYEVKISPVSGQLIAVGGGQNNLAAGIQLVISYGISVFVRPVEMTPIVQATRHGTSLTLSNTGNTSVIIGTCKQCQNNTCQDAKISAQLYPGNTKTFTLPEDAPLNCQEEILQNHFTPFKIP